MIPFFLGLCFGAIPVSVMWIAINEMDSYDKTPEDKSAIMPADRYQQIKEMAEAQDKSTGLLEKELIIQRLDELKEDFKSHDNR